MEKKAFEESSLLLKLLLRPPHKKELNRMKATTFFLVFFAIGLFAAETHSQVSKVSIDVVDVTVREVLREIEKQTDYLFIFNPNEINLNRKTSLQIKDEMVADVLSDIFRKTDVIYAMEGNNIMLMKGSAVFQ